ncbi:hypothetical protein GQ457_18G005940 [Hibiscus cannabinus]
MRGLLVEVQLMKNSEDKLMWLHNVAGAFSVKKLTSILEETNLDDLDFELGKNLGLEGKLVGLATSVLNWIATPAQRPWRRWSLLVVIDILVKRSCMLEFKFIGRQSNAMAVVLTRDGLFKAWW